MITVNQNTIVVVLCPKDKTELIEVPVEKVVAYRFPGEMVQKVLVPGMITTRYFCMTCKETYEE